MIIRTADYIANFLADQKITDVFTVTGGGAMHLNNAFGKHPKLKCTYFHHEQACAIAAEGYARTSGKPAVVCVTSGPGGTNALTGVLGAYLDSVPLFVVSGQVKYATTVQATGLPLRQFGDQEYDIVKSAKPMTKYAAMVKDAQKIKKRLQKAWCKMNQGRKGPVWLDVPLNIQSEKIDDRTLKAYDQQNKTFEASKADIDVLVEKLLGANRPVILAGTGIRHAGAHTDFLKLVDKLNIPVTTAWNAHDVLVDKHPMFAGRPGTVGDRPGNLVLQKADFMLVLGCRLNIRQISYNYKAFAPHAFKAVVDIDKTELDKPSVNIDLPIFADVKDVIEKLNKRILKRKNNIDSWRNWCKTTKASYPVVTKKHVQDADGLNIYHFMDRLFNALPSNATVVASNGSASVCAFQAAIIKQNTRLFTNSGCAAMGYGLPAAIGAQLSQKNGSVVCLEGDGSLQMNLQELQTMVHNHLPIKLFVINNDGYHSIRQTQNNMFASDAMHGVNAQTGISFPSVAKIAIAYGVHYIKIKDKKTLEADIKKVISKRSAVLAEVVVTSTQNFEPKLAAIKRADGSIYSPPPYDLSPLLPADELETLMGIKRKSEE